MNLTHHFLLPMLPPSCSVLQALGCTLQGTKFKARLTRLSKSAGKDVLTSLHQEDDKRHPELENRERQFIRQQQDL